MDQQAEKREREKKKKKTERALGLGRRTREKTVKWKQMTALRFQTGWRHQTSLASLHSDYINPWCDLDIEDSEPIFLHVKNGCVVQEMLSRNNQAHAENIIWTFTDILNLHCDLDLKCSNPIFPQDTLTFDAVLSNQVSLQMD